MIQLVDNIVAKDIKSYLDDLIKEGIDLGIIRIGALDPKPDELAVINEYGGLTHDPRFGVVGIGYEKPTIQLTFRGVPHDYETPMRRARMAWGALASVQPGTIADNSTIIYQKITPIQSPFSLGKDHNERFEIVCNYLIEKEPV